MILSKEASNKDVNLKTQMMIAMNDNNKGESSTERMWKENCFFKDQRTNITIVKGNFPENMLFMSIMGQSRLLKEDMHCILNSLSSHKLCL